MANYVGMYLCGGGLAFQGAVAVYIYKYYSDASMMYYSIPFSFAKTEQISQGIFVSFYGENVLESLRPISLLRCCRALSAFHLCSMSCQYSRLGMAR
jgi:hypothetical protein